MTPAENACVADLKHASPFGALTDNVGDPACVALTCLPPWQMVRLRLYDLGDAAALDLPTIPNTVNGTQPWRFWLGPGEWLLADPDDLGDTVARLTQSLGDRPYSLTAVAAASLTLAGPEAGAVLARGCPLDLRQLPPGHCARTLLGQVGVLLHRRAVHEYDLHVDVSVARHVSTWLRAVVADLPRLIHP